jgi:hypothetical protein
VVFAVSLTSKEDAGNLAQDTEEDQEYATPSPSGTVRTAGDGNYTVILGEEVS